MIVVVGSYGVGLSVAVDRAPEPGQTVVGRDFRSGHGGKGSNQAIAARRLGADVRLCSAVGTDDFGQAARRLWAAEGVDDRLVVTRPGATMVGVILVESGGENRIAIAPGVLDDFTPDCLAELPAALVGADVLLVGLEIPVATAHEALRLGREAGVRTILNPAPAPDEPLPRGLLDLADVLTPNRGEAAQLAGLPPDADPADCLAAPCFASASIVALTLGERGVLLRSGDGTVRLPAPRVDVVDSTGAGDAFNGAFAVALSRGWPAEPAARYAVQAAARSVTRREVVASLPRAAELVQALPTTGSER